MPKVIGLTGGIATGKSTVSKLLSEYGFKIVDADLCKKSSRERINCFGTNKKKRLAMKQSQVTEK